MSRPAGAAVDPALHPPTSGVTPLLFADRKPGSGVGQLRKAACRSTHPSGLVSVTLRRRPDSRETPVTAVTTRHQAVSPFDFTSSAPRRRGLVHGRQLSLSAPGARCDAPEAVLRPCPPPDSAPRSAPRSFLPAILPRLSSGAAAGTRARAEVLRRDLVEELAELLD